jgi:hypothetical protein
MEAVAPAVLALYFQRAADRMSEETRRTNRAEMQKAA